VNINSLTGEILKFEKKSLFDIVMIKKKRSKPHKAYNLLFLHLGMKNKNVGWLIIGISIFIFIIILAFNMGLRNIVDQTCDHGPTCSMYSTMSLQTWISVAIAFLVLVIGIFLVFSRENERIIVKKVRPFGKLDIKKFDGKGLDKLDNEEKKIMNLILKNKGSIFQSGIVEKTGFNKVKVTRILDGLEAQGLIERRRRGMTNIVMLKKSE
jgi:predicted transcriptional regulator